MFSLAISSICHCWRSRSRSIAAASSGSALKRVSKKKPSPADPVGREDGVERIKGPLVERKDVPPRREASRRPVSDQTQWVRALTLEASLRPKPLYQISTNDASRLP